MDVDRVSSVGARGRWTRIGPAWRDGGDSARTFTLASHRDGTRSSPRTSDGSDALFRQNCALLATLMPRLSPACIRRKMNADRGVILTVIRRHRRRQATVVACAVLRRHAHERIAELVLFGVRRSHWARGIGRRLMDRVKTVASAWFAATSVVTFASYNAVSFFQKMAFAGLKDGPERRRALRVIDAYHHAVPMIHRLGVACAPRDRRND